MAAANPVSRQAVGLADIPRALFAPRSVLARVEDVKSWLWPLVALLALTTLIGYASVQTGLVDRQIDLKVARRIAEQERMQRNVVERSALRDMIERELKQGEFEKLLTRVQVIAAEPLKVLATTLLIAAVLYGMVALTGRKPEWNTLLTICVLAGFVEALRLLVKLGLMLHFRTLEVDTSLSVLAWPLLSDQGLEPTAIASAAGAMTALDPFRIWYWWIVLVGLAVTSQLRGWRSATICMLCWLVGAVVRAGISAGMVASTMTSTNPQA